VSMDDRLDALDLAIMALPLEEPPAGLRSSILMATAYRPLPAVSFWELAIVGALGGVAVWLLALLVLGGGSLFAHTLSIIGSTALQAFSNATTVTWVAVGGATALWLSLFTGFQPIARVPHRSTAKNLR
jgi:hypothetical protein